MLKHRNSRTLAQCPGTTFAGTSPSTRNLLDLPEFELDRRRTAEDRHSDLDPRPLLVDVFDDHYAHAAVVTGQAQVGDMAVLDN